MNKFKALAGITIAAGMLAVPTLASAHDAVASATCRGGLSWNAHDYEPQQTNSIVVKVDGGNVHADASFGTHDTGHVDVDKTKAHTWSVVVNAPGTQYDRNLSGATVACQEVIPTTTEGAPTTTVAEGAPTTTAAPATTVAPTTTVAAVVTTATPTTPAPTVAVVPATPRAIAAVPLPQTGRNYDVQIAIAFVCVAGGWSMLRMRRAR